VKWSTTTSAKTVRSSDGTVAAIDLTFSAPKSVSVLRPLGRTLRGPVSGGAVVSDQMAGRPHGSDCRRIGGKWSCCRVFLSIVLV
jgi:hypothetical protein